LPAIRGFHQYFGPAISGQVARVPDRLRSWRLLQAEGLKRVMHPIVELNDIEATLGGTVQRNAA
jgi:hypothetical protein